MDSTPSLDSLRGEIDEIDSKIHDLLMRRTQVSRTIANAKPKGPTSFRLAREMQVLRRLVARHAGPLPRAVLVRLWREILADSLSQQGPFAVAAYSAEPGSSLTGLARDHFGVLTPVLERGSAVRVINAVVEGECSIGLLPPPASDAPDAWWRYLARSGEKVPRIIGYLPFAPAAAPSGADQTALVIGLVDAEPSGADHSFLVLEAGSELSRSAARSLVEKADLPVHDTVLWDSPSEGYLLLVEVADFVGRDDPRLKRLQENNGGRIQHCWLIGGYPLPFAEADLVDPRVAAKERERS